ncbi:DNA primase [Sulfitobacter donghicola DSW-25 = KCTC 12864 = JCM 14565]|nr:DNA primase [Sulfitobacter donghicola DSW-25 = KCTC 12864 = JCM 14565]
MASPLPLFQQPNAFIRITFDPMNIAQAKCIPLKDYLERQGITASKARQGGRELWYRSPIRQGDENPSFKVDTVKNLWFDHGAATGGNIIDLVRELCSCDVRDALQHLEKTGLYSPALSKPSISAETSRGASRQLTATPGKQVAEGEKEKTATFELVSQGPLEHPALLQYLTKRGIDHDIARVYVRQIDFKAPQGAGSYFALGYPSGDGFEARNALFKGFVGSGKSVTFHDNPDRPLLQVFEGFMDFLSYLSVDRPTQPAGAVLVLNSTNLWQRALPYINDPRFREVRLYLDNDDAGDAATRKLFENVDDRSRLADMRSYYEGYEDLNAWLLGEKS